MVIGVLKSKKEKLVALVPKVVEKLIQDNHQINIENGAGSDSSYPDSTFKEAGANLVSRKDILQSSDIVLTFSEIDPTEVAMLKPEALLIGKFNAGVESPQVQAMKENNIKAFSLDLLPRSSIAQSMDILSSLASLSGYKAALVAASHYAGYIPMMSTSAGTVPPARVLVIGAGVAGLQAIATAKRLGAMVEAFDVRSSVKEEVESLGAKFIEVAGSQEDDSAGGYAIEQSEEYIKKQKELIHIASQKANIVITTANIPNKKAPLLIEERTVRSMKPGSVIMDMATASGGNVALSEDNKIIDIEGVTIIGDSKLYNQLGNQASLFYSNNLYSFLQFISKDGFENLPYDSEIVSKTLIQNEETLVEVN